MAEATSAGRGGSDPLRIADWIEGIIDLPMVVLSFVFLALVVVEIVVPVSPRWSRVISLTQWAIWTIFTIEFVIMLALARDKRRYLRRNWLAALSVVLPFLRGLRVLRAVRALRTLKLFRLMALTTRSARQVGQVLQVRGAGYVALTTVLLTLFGAAGMYLVEQGAPDSTIRTFGDALWWSAAAITTVGSDLSPRTAEGRVLAVVVYLFGMALIGYITAVLASYFVGKQAKPQPGVQEANREIRETAERQPESDEDLRQQVDRLIALMERRSEAGRGEGT